MKYVDGFVSLWTSWIMSSTIYKDSSHAGPARVESEGHCVTIIIIIHFTIMGLVAQLKFYCCFGGRRHANGEFHGACRKQPSLIQMSLRTTLLANTLCTEGVQGGSNSKSWPQSQIRLLCKIMWCVTSPARERQALPSWHHQRCSWRDSASFGSTSWNIWWPPLAKVDSLA